MTAHTHISNPYISGFCFVACQLGASEYQLGPMVGLRPRDIFSTNVKIGSLLAFPYHARRGGTPMTMDELLTLHRQWASAPGSVKLRSTTEHTLHEFRSLIDPWMKHDRGGPSAPGSSNK